MKNNKFKQFLFITILVVTLTVLLVACGAGQQEAPPIRDVGADVCAWEALDWSDLNATEQEVWGVLGWDATSWEAEEEAGWPESEFKDWAELSEAEQEAAGQLGYTQDTWDNVSCE